ncbi:MAG: hypothetical protein QXD23_00275 [Candidatus Micrarchaeaceae archaeon]
MSQTQFITSGLSLQDIGILLVIVILYIIYRIYKNTKGIQYTQKNIYRGPVIYLILVFLGLLSFNTNYIDFIIVIFSIILGYFIGRKLSVGVKFFEKNGITFYKRSPLILEIWLISFLARFIIEILYPNIFILSLITEIILALTTGLILGEAYHIVISHKQKKN